MYNRDHRIILLRERLYDEGWTIINLTIEESLHDHKTIKSNQQPTTVTITEWPQINDYNQHHMINKSALLETKNNLRQQGTSLTKMLADDISLWQQLTPSWISAKTCIMLTGLINTDGRLSKGNLAKGGTPPGCNEECRLIEIRDSNYREHTGLKEQNHATLHRLFRCHRFKEQQIVAREIMNKAMHQASHNGQQVSRYSPWNDNKATEITLQSKNFRTIFLKQLTKVAGI